MKAWSYWFPDLMPHVPGCPQVLAEHELRRAAQAFFEQTRAWQVNKAVIPVTAGTAEIELTPDGSDLELVRVESGWFDGKPIDPTTADKLDGDYGDDWQTHTGTPTAYLQLSPGLIRLYPIPLANAATGLKLRLSVTPSDASEGLPDQIATKFRDHMHVGAKSRLMLYPGKPWTNLDLAAVYATAFNNLVAQATAAAARAFVQARIPSRPKWC